MKERTRKGKFRRTESVSYKMTQHHGFDAVSWQAFQEAAIDKYDFSRCQRSDGSYYGTGGTCRKGTEAGAKQEEPKKAKSSGGGGDSNSGGGGSGGGGKYDTSIAKLEKTKGAVDDKTMAANSLKYSREAVGNRESAKAALDRYQKYDKEAGRKTSEGTEDAKRKYEKALKNELEAKKQTKNLIDNKEEYSKLAKKFTDKDNITDADKAKFNKAFGAESTVKQAQTTMNKINKLSGGGKSSAKPAAKSSGGDAAKPKAAPKAKKEAAPKKPKGGSTYESKDLKKLDKFELEKEVQRLYKVSKGKSAARFDAFESLDKVRAELDSR